MTKEKKPYLLSTFNILQTGVYPQDYIGLEPAVYYNDYYHTKLISHLNEPYKYRRYEKPAGLNVNAAFVIEYWERIPPEILPGPTYQAFYVSTLGRVYNASRNIIKVPFIRKDGYIGIGFSSFIVPLHRVVLYTFCPHPNFKNLTVNHKSFDVTENYLWNLEWCTMKENVERSIAAGNRTNPHFLPGALNNKATITEEQARKICEMLLEGYPNCEIAIRMGISQRTVSHIRNRESFAYLYDEYGLERVRIRRNNNTLT